MSVSLIALLLLSGCSSTNSNSTLTIQDVESSFQAKGLTFTSTSIANVDMTEYNHIAPTEIINFEENDLSNEEVKVYVYSSAEAMKKGLQAFQDEIAKDLTYGLKDSVYTRKNIMVIGKWFSDDMIEAINHM